MISLLLLPLLVAPALVAPAPAAPAQASSDDPPIRLWLDERTLLPGDPAKVQVQTEYDGYLLVLHVDSEGHLRVLFPIDPDKDNFARGGKRYEVRGRGGRETFEADGKGRGAVYAAVSHDPFRFDGYVLGDHWDYKALAPSRLAEDPEPELNELVQRMAQSSFDYDMINYDVVERSTYASSYYPSYSGSVYGNSWCCGYYGWPYGFSIGLSFGYPYYSYPFYSPFYYPYYAHYPYYGYYPYYPYYRRPYYPGYYYPAYHGRYYYWDRQRSYGPYSPYRFRTADGFTGGYRDRRFDLRRPGGTGYVSRFTGVRQPSSVSTARRVIENPTAELPKGKARRTVGHEQRLERGKVEARRARERQDQPRTMSSGDAGRRERQPVEARRSRSEAGRQHDERSEPRLERRREEPRAERRGEPRAVERREPRAVERSRGEPRGAGRAPESRSAPSYDRGGPRGEGRGPGASPPGGGGRPSDGGGRRRT
jgi:hypothetical protein